MSLFKNKSGSVGHQKNGFESKSKFKLGLENHFKEGLLNFALNPVIDPSIALRGYLFFIYRWPISTNRPTILKRYNGAYLPAFF